MAKILLYLSLAVIVATAALGFMSKQRVETVKTALSQSKTSEKQARDQSTKLSGELKETNTKLADANKQVEEQTAKVKQTETELETAKSEVAKANSELEDTKKKLADAASAKPVDAPVVKDDTTTIQITELTKKLEDKTKELAEAQQVADTLKQRDHESSDKLATTERELQRYKIGGYRAGITGRVVAVNKGWNFVVVDVGDRRGSAVNAPLLVKRGGQQVARLRVTSVEPGSSIADVIPGSMARGESVQLGDTVVFAGRQPGPQDQAAPAPGGAQPAIQPPTGGATTPQAQQL